MRLLAMNGFAGAVARPPRILAELTTVASTSIPVLTRIVSALSCAVISRTGPDEACAVGVLGESARRRYAPAWVRCGPSRRTGGTRHDRQARRRALRRKDRQQHPAEHRKRRLARFAPPPRGSPRAGTRPAPIRSPQRSCPATTASQPLPAMPPDRSGGAASRRSFLFRQSNQKDNGKANTSRAQVSQTGRWAAAPVRI